MSNISTVRENGNLASARAYERRVVAPPVDVLENADELLIVADVPGVPGDGIDLLVENGTLTLRAKRSAPVWRISARIASAMASCKDARCARTSPLRPWPNGAASFVSTFYAIRPTSRAFRSRFIRRWRWSA